MKKKLSKKIMIVIFIIVFLLVFLVLYLMFGFEEKVIHKYYSPGETYYITQSKLTGICYVKIHYGCSAVECDSFDTEFKMYSREKCKSLK